MSDIYGHLEKLTLALYAAGFIDADGNWAGTDARLWFFGDFFDRGLDGIGVLHYVWGLVDQVFEGAVWMLFGNHEIFVLGMHWFGDTFVPHDGITLRSFERLWVLNGGQDCDQELFIDEDVIWFFDQSMLGIDADQLLMYSDIVEYVEWGDTLDQINIVARAELHSDDIEVWWEIWCWMTSWYAFCGESGLEVVRIMLQHFGGCWIVHGHSIIADQLHIDLEFFIGPHLYADGLVFGIDGGAFDGGFCLVVELSAE